MTNEELVSAIQAGERDKLGALWGQVERFVSMSAGKVSRSTGGRIDAEDLYQSGFLALVAAVESYNSGAGMSFVGWLAFHLKTAFAEAGGCRTNRQMQDPIHRAGSLDSPIGEDEDGATLGDLQPDPAAEQAFTSAEERVFNQQLHAALDNALHSLQEDQEEIIRARYYQGRTLREIGAERGMSTGYVGQIEGKALCKLRHPRIARELKQYLEERTPYYSGTGYGSFQHGGSQPERLAIMRERWAGT